MRMFIHLYFPENFSNFGISRVNVSGLVAEVRDQFAAGPLLESDRASDACFDFQCPVDATRFRIQHVQFALDRADVQTAACHNRLSSCRARSGKTKRPFQLEVRHVVCSHSRSRGGLESGVGDVVAPAIPGRARQRICRRSRGWIAERGLRNQST